MDTDTVKERKVLESLESRLMKSYEDLNMLLPLLPVRLQCVLQLPLEISAKKCCT